MEMEIEFIVTNDFAWAARKLLGKEGVAGIQAALKKDPEAGDVISGGKGLRKLRFALPGRGKSGGVRVIYFYLSMPQKKCFLFEIYAKADRANLTDKEVNVLAKFIATLK